MITILATHYFSLDIQPVTVEDYRNISSSKGCGRRVVVKDLWLKGCGQGLWLTGNGKRVLVNGLLLTGYEYHTVINVS